MNRFGYQGMSCGGAVNESSRSVMQSKNPIPMQIPGLGMFAT
ncbi:hypothetical protein ACE1BG_07740 [Aeromonas veronii]